MASDSKLSQEHVKKVFDELGRKMAQEGRVAEIAIYGGMALMLMFDARESTKDVDYVPVSGDVKRLREVARELGCASGFSEDWLNDSVAIFKSDNANHAFFGDFPRGGQAGLRVFTATPEYLFAMKCLSMRGIFDSSDSEDVWLLAHECGIKTMDHAMEIVESYYPGKLPGRNRLVLEDVFDAIGQNRPFSKAYFW